VLVPTKMEKKTFQVTQIMIQIFCTARSRVIQNPGVFRMVKKEGV